MCQSIEGVRPSEFHQNLSIIPAGTHPPKSKSAQYKYTSQRITKHISQITDDNINLSHKCQSTVYITYWSNNRLEKFFIYKFWTKKSLLHEKILTWVTACITPCSVYTNTNSIFTVFICVLTNFAFIYLAMWLQPQEYFNSISLSLPRMQFL